MGQKDDMADAGCFDHTDEEYRRECQEAAEAYDKAHDPEEA